MAPCRIYLVSSRLGTVIHCKRDRVYNNHRSFNYLFLSFFFIKKSAWHQTSSSFKTFRLHFLLVKNEIPFVTFSLFNYFVAILSVGSIECLRPIVSTTFSADKGYFLQLYLQWNDLLATDSHEDLMVQVCKLFSDIQCWQRVKIVLRRSLKYR